MREQSDLIAIVLAIFATLMVGVYLSPSFEETKSLLLILMNILIVVVVFGLLVGIAYLGFASFALYGAIFVAMVMAMFGFYGVLLVVGMSYLIWGFIFAFEALLVGHRVVSAQEWFKGRYTYASFYKEYLVFYPMLFIVYAIVEALPTWLDFQKPPRFDPHAILLRMREILQ